MKEDFQEVRQQLDSIGIKRIASDFYMEPIRKGSYFFVRSPATNDKTPSLALYSNNRFCDFANGNFSGDSIGFVAYIKGCRQWDALQELTAFYGLSGSKTQNHEKHSKIIEQKQQESEHAKRNNAFQTVLKAYIEALKQNENIYTLAIKNAIYEPYSDMWCYCMDELQKIAYKLDILTAADQAGYRRMKKGPNIQSDRPMWLLDTLTILKNDSVFSATQKEIEQIREQIPTL